MSAPPITRRRIVARAGGSTAVGAGKRRLGECAEVVSTSTVAAKVPEILIVKIARVVNTRAPTATSHRRVRRVVIAFRESTTTVAAKVPEMPIESIAQLVNTSAPSPVQIRTGPTSHRHRRVRRVIVAVRESTTTVAAKVPELPRVSIARLINTSAPTATKLPRVRRVVVAEAGSTTTVAAKVPELPRVPIARQINIRALGATNRIVLTFLRQVPSRQLLRPHARILTAA
jgi:hypothetical protein